MFTTTTSGVMVKTQPAIHLSLGTVMRLAILKHAQKSRAIIRQVKQNARPINKRYTKASQLNSNQTEITDCLRRRPRKLRTTERKGAYGYKQPEKSRGRGFRLKGLEEG